jgi:ligand-binding sensor domain-containing protein
VSGVFEPFPETADLKVNTGCLVEAGGRLYLGTDGRGLWRLSTDGTRFVQLKVPLPSSHITAILPGRNALFVGTDQGLARLPEPLAEEPY